MLPGSHPIHHKHKDLCPGVLEKAREFRGRFDPGSLQADATLISDFRVSSPGSRSFKARLIELTAIAIHEIAVRLFNFGLGGHADDGMATWVPEKDDIFWTWYEGPWPTLFRHTWYTAYEKYPSGIADGVGFWAEARIFGGVVLFDRRAPPEGDPDSVWFHPDRDGGTSHFPATRRAEASVLGVPYIDNPGSEVAANYRRQEEHKQGGPRGAHREDGNLPSPVGPETPRTI